MRRRVAGTWPTGRARTHVRALEAPCARGAATAEAAAVLPLLVWMALLCVWLVALAATQVRVVDAAREVARTAARGDAETTAIAAGRRVAPPGSSLALGFEHDLVVARVRARVELPRFLRFLPAPTLHAEAVAASEGP